MSPIAVTITVRLAGRREDAPPNLSACTITAVEASVAGGATYRLIRRGSQAPGLRALMTLAPGASINFASVCLLVRTFLASRTALIDFAIEFDDPPRT